MKVLVTGGAGFIGSFMVKSLLKFGYEPTVLDNLSTGNILSVPQNVSFYKVDISDNEKVSEILSNNTFVAVLHFAGSIIVSESIENPINYYENNAVKSLQFIKTCLNHNLDKFIFSSTAAVYGNGTKLKLKEDCPKIPINPYGKSKLIIEEMLIDLSKIKRLKYVILRYFNVAGADTDGSAGQFSKTSTHLIKLACEVAHGKRPFLEIYGNDYNTKDGSCVRDYIHIIDLISAHLKSLEFLLCDKGSNIFNCGYGNGFSVFDIIKKFEKVLGKALPIKVVGRRIGDPPYLVSNNEKIINELGWVPKYNNIEKIIGDALSWEKKLSKIQNNNLD